MLDSRPVSIFHGSFREGVDLSTVTGSDTCLAATLPLLQFFFQPYNKSGARGGAVG